MPTELGGTWVAATVVVSAFLVLGLAPAFLHARERAVSREIDDLLIPARALVAAHRHAVERTISTRAGYHFSADRLLYERSLTWQQECDEAASRLETLLSSVDAEARRLWNMVERHRRDVESPIPTGPERPPRLQAGESPPPIHMLAAVPMHRKHVDSYVADRVSFLDPDSVTHENMNRYAFAGSYRMNTTIRPGNHDIDIVFRL